MVLAQAEWTKEYVARCAFEALKADDFGRLRPVLPTAKDVLWLMESVQEADPKQAEEMAAELDAKRAIKQGTELAARIWTGTSWTSNTARK